MSDIDGKAARGAATEPGGEGVKDETRSHVPQRLPAAVAQSKIRPGEPALVSLSLDP
jgi:hypothetical protein